MTQPRTLRNFIGGEYVDATGDASIDLVNPATGQVVAHAPVSTQADVDAAYASAEAGFAEWSEATPGERQSALLKFADAIEKRLQALPADVYRPATDVAAAVDEREEKPALTLPDTLKNELARLVGAETRLFGELIDAPCRVYARPAAAQLKQADADARLAEGGALPIESWRQSLDARIGWDEASLLPVGQGIEAVRPIRDDIRGRVETLIDELLPARRTA